MHLTRVIVFLIAASLLASCKTTLPLDAYQGLSNKQIFQNSEQNMQKHHYEAAVKDLEALDTLYPFGAYSQQAQLNIITAYYKNDDTESALAATDRYIRLYPRADNVDEAYYLKGLINEGAKENWFSKAVHAEPTQRDISTQKQAFQDFDILVTRFPNSKYAPQARRHMAELHSLIAQHKLSIAQYYLDHKAYVAAVNRATEIVKSYSDTPQVAPALGILVQGYRAINEPDLANNALRTLVNKYPNSKEARTLNK